MQRKERYVSKVREKIEDLLEYLKVLKARVRDEGKPRITHNDVKKRYG